MQSLCELMAVIRKLPSIDVDTRWRARELEVWFFRFGPQWEPWHLEQFAK